MKKILITGVSSYIGSSFRAYLQQWPEKYQVDAISLRDSSWKQKDFSVYDTVLHAAGIVHQRETEENRRSYYKINRNLTIQVACKAKESGVYQFIFLSTMSVYGMDAGVITPKTKPVPTSHYGRSKLEAEKRLKAMSDGRFLISILRPPMVYGKDCKGNFQLLVRLIQRSPIFPNIQNQRSMISIGNLCSFLRFIIDNRQAGLFFPQNRCYMNTTVMAREISQKIHTHIFFSRLAGLMVNVIMPFSGKARKAFSTLIYQGCEQFDFCYCIESIRDSIRESV